MLSHGGYNGSKVAVRVMHYLQWVNSKVFFYSMRSRFFPGKPTAEKDLPVMVHMNYHPDKHKRMYAHPTCRSPLTMLSATHIAYRSCRGP